jgi:hypothetical protein
LNAFVGGFGAWLIGLVAGRIYGPAAQKRTFLLAAFFPSLVLWSSVNLRDCWNWLVVAMSLLATINLRERFSLKDLLLVGLCVAFLPMIRSYMLLLVGTGVVLSFLVVRIRSLPVSLIAFPLVIGVMLTIGDSFNMDLMVDMDERLELMNRMKWGMSGGNAGYYRGVDISTPEGALRYLPTGVSIFLFAPFPWTPSNLRQAIAVPETMVWYVIFFQAMRHMWRTRKTTIMRAAPVFFTTVVMILAYGLVEGNEGTAFRHRSQVMLLFFVFAGGDFAFRVGRRLASHRFSATTAPALVPTETAR